MFGTASCAHDVVQFVDVEDNSFLFGGSFEDVLKAFFKVAPVLCAGQELPHVHAIDACRLEPFGHVASQDALSQSVDEGCFAHARLANV